MSCCYLLILNSSYSLRFWLSAFLCCVDMHTVISWMVNKAFHFFVWFHVLHSLYLQIFLSLIINELVCMLLFFCLCFFKYCFYVCVFSKGRAWLTCEHHQIPHRRTISVQFLELLLPGQISHHLSVCTCVGVSLCVCVSVCVHTTSPLYTNPLDETTNWGLQCVCICMQKDHIHALKILRSMSQRLIFEMSP